MLRIENLTKRVVDNVAVNRAMLDVDKPCKIDIIGRSGAGQSTLLRMINRLTDSTEDRILFEGCDVTRSNGREKRAWQADYTMIFQQFDLLPRIDVVSNVLHGTLHRHCS